MNVERNMFLVWKIQTCLYADDAVLFAESEQKLQKIILNEFDREWEKRKLEVNAVKSNIVVFERMEHSMIK